MDVQSDVIDQYNESLLGQEREVLCEGFDPVSESYYGRTYRDAAEIDGKIWFASKKKVSAGDFVDVRVTDIMDYDLVGEAL